MVRHAAEWVEIQSVSFGDWKQEPVQLGMTGARTQREVRGLGEEAEKWNYWLQLQEKKKCCFKGSWRGWRGDIPRECIITFI